MRIVEWNCRSKFTAKLPALEALHPDIAVLAEAPLINPRPDDTLTDTAISWWARGQFGFKSLAVAGFTSPLIPVEMPEGTGSWSVAADHPSGFGILGIWACPEPSHRYASEITKSLDAYDNWIRSHDVVIAGDFNVTYDGTERTLFRSVLKRLNELDMVPLITPTPDWNTVPSQSRPTSSAPMRTPASTSTSSSSPGPGRIGSRALRWAHTLSG